MGATWSCCVEERKGKATPMAARPRLCPGNCGYLVTWHATHCCDACAMLSAVDASLSSLGAREAERSPFTGRRCGGGSHSVHCDRALFVQCRAPQQCSYVERQSFGLDGVDEQGTGERSPKPARRLKKCVSESGLYLRDGGRSVAIGGESSPLSRPLSPLSRPLSPPLSPRSPLSPLSRSERRSS